MTTREHISKEERQSQVAMLAWPASWPEIVNAEFLRDCGFQIV